MNETQTYGRTFKKYLDTNFEPYWLVFFGKNFGCHSIHEKRRFIYFYIDKIAYLFYKIQ
ncbi:unnamed protein product [Paramecium sonneborni]|uniref:Uncharacterized protein n=1 Tax=Paramecium sonneborni TaxID=65129 RepID=A0A8S1KQP8_9CILI|nr:unnamed protein product [Paramecium sonneborni]